MLLVPYMWASMTFLPMQSLMDHKALVVLTHWSFSWDVHVKQVSNSKINDCMKLCKQWPRPQVTGLKIGWSYLQGVC